MTEKLTAKEKMKFVDNIADPFVKELTDNKCFYVLFMHCGGSDKREEMIVRSNMPPALLVFELEKMKIATILRSSQGDEKGDK